jgi:hypothetical protein
MSLELAEVKLPEIYNWLTYVRKWGAPQSDGDLCTEKWGTGPRRKIWWGPFYFVADLQLC